MVLVSYSPGIAHCCSAGHLGGSRETFFPLQCPSAWLQEAWAQCHALLLYTLYSGDRCKIPYQIQEAEEMSAQHRMIFNPIMFPEPYFWKF